MSVNCWCELDRDISSTFLAAAFLEFSMQDTSYDIV